MKIINNIYEKYIVGLSVLGILVCLYCAFTSSSGNFISMLSGISSLFIFLAVFFIFITLYSLQLKITIYFLLAMVGIYGLISPQNILFVALMFFIIFQRLPRWKHTSHLNDKKTTILRANQFMLQRYTTIFMVFVVLRIVLSFVFYNATIEQVFDPLYICGIIISTSILITIYMSVDGVVESMYFYVIAVIFQIVSIVLTVISINVIPLNYLLVYISPFLIMLCTLYVYYLLFKERN